MYPAFTKTLRRYGLFATPAQLIDLIQGIDEGYAPTVGDLFFLSQATFVKTADQRAPFEQAFFSYFLGIDTAEGMKLADAIYNSKPFDRWLELYVLNGGEFEKGEDEVEVFVSSAFSQSSLFDAMKAKNGKRIGFDDTNMPAHEVAEQPFNPRTHNGSGEMNLNDTLNGIQGRKLEDTGGYKVSDDHTADKIDYAGMSKELLEERLLEVMKAQREAHEGGTDWIGTKGNSAFGHSGFSRNGIRVGGVGRWGSARSVIADGTHYDHKKTDPLADDALRVALEDLKLMRPTGRSTVVDVQRTVAEAGRKGDVTVYYKPREKDVLEVVVFIDNGGRSMTNYVPAVRTMLSKMDEQLRSVVKYYFHNCIYDDVGLVPDRSKVIPLDDVLERNKETRIVIIGDGTMSPNEVNENTLRAIRARFPYAAWLNPTAKSLWRRYETIGSIRKIMPMYSITPDGVKQAVHMLKGEYR